MPSAVIVSRNNGDRIPHRGATYSAFCLFHSQILDCHEIPTSSSERNSYTPRLEPPSGLPDARTLVTDVHAQEKWGTQASAPQYILRSELFHGCSKHFFHSEIAGTPADSVKLAAAVSPDSMG